MTAFTVSTKLSLPPWVPSETVTVTVAAPLRLATGVAMTVRLAPLPPNTRLASGSKLGLLEAALTVRSAALLSTSPMVNAIAPVLASSSIVRSAMSLMVGASLTGATITKKVSVALSAPSETVTVMVAEPLLLAAGVTVSVRFAPLPLSTRPAGGIKSALSLAGETSRLSSVLSVSLTVNSSGPVLASSTMAWSAMAEITGASFTGLTVTTIGARPATRPSLSVMVKLKDSWICVAVAGAVNDATALSAFVSTTAGPPVWVHS